MLGFKSIRAHRSVLLRGVMCLAIGSASGEAAAQIALPGIVVEGATLSQPDRPSSGPSGASTPATADATGVDSERDGYPADSIGSSVSVVTSAELERQQIRHAADALRGLPGVSVNRAGSFAAQTQVRIRGAEGNHTLVLIDGIVANQPGTGEFDFSNLLADQIDRIEVIRGAQSSLYGTGAIGGVVNIITKRGRGPASTTVWAEAGSFATVESGASVSGGTDRAHGLLSYSVRNSNGYNIAVDGNETDASAIRSFVMKGGISPTENFSVDVFARNVDKRGDRDGDLFALSGLSRQTDTFSHFASNLWLAGVEAKLDTFDGRLQHRARYNFAQTILEDTDIGDFGASYSRNDNRRRTASYLATLDLGTPSLSGVLRHSLTGLVEHDYETFNQVTGNDITRDRSRVAFAGEYRADLFDRLTVTGNLRHDNNDTFDDFTTWRVASSLRVLDRRSWWGLRPHASYGTAVKLPTMVEQFGQFAGFIPNPDLLAEESSGWDAGIEVSFAHGLVVVDATYFSANLENEIVTRFLPFFQSTVENLLGESTREGVELSARWRPATWISLGAAYTWLDSRDDQGLPEIRRARDSGRLDATMAFAGGRGSVTVAAIYNGTMPDFAFGLPTFETVRVRLDDYWLASIAARYELKPGVEVFGRVENLFDADYQEVYGFETAGIAAYAGLKIKFGGEDGVGAQK